MGMRKHIAGVLACLAFGSALGEVIAPSEDFLKAPDRIEWHAGGLYDGRFEDGTRFQIQLAYPRPASVPKEAMPFSESYWYPKHFRGRMLMLNRADGMGNTVRLVVQPDPRIPAEESFSIALAPDMLSGSGTWTSSTLKKQMAFTLQRAVAYDYVVVQRPAPPEARNGDPARSFVFAAWFPVLGDADADAWIREQAGKCDGDLECANRVSVRWKSSSLLSLDASVWEYNYMTPHGNGGSTTRQYGVDNGRLTPLGLDAFVDTGPACASSVTAAIVAQLHAQQLPWADKWAEQAPVQKTWLKFTPTASGIEFHFDPYEVGPYAQGSPSVFLTRPQLGQCLRHLPASD
jgi:hypothetical protein